MVFGLRVGIIKDVDMASTYAAAFILRSVDSAVDHDLGTVGNHRRVYRDGVAGSGYGAGAGVASPTSGAAFTGAIAGGLEYAQRLKLGDRAGSCVWFHNRLRSSIGIGPGVGKGASVYRTLDHIDTVSKRRPVYI